MQQILLYYTLTIIIMQIYIGKPRKTAVLIDREVDKELAEGMKVATKADEFIRVGVARSIHHGTITVQWYKQNV